MFFSRKIGAPERQAISQTVPLRKLRRLRCALAAAATRSGQSEDGADQEHPDDDAGGLSMDRADAKVPVPVNAHAGRLSCQCRQGSY